MEIGKIEVEVTDGNFRQEVLESKLSCLVDFWAEWCMPCRIVAPTVEEIAREYQGKLKVCKVNVDEAPDTALRYGIMSIPTLAIFKNGEIINKILGAVSKAELEIAIKSHI